MKRLTTLVLPLALSGCMVDTIGKTAVGIVTLPVKVVSAGVDAATTSQAEADEKRGRDIRKQEEAQGERLRQAQTRCHKGKALPTDNCAAVHQR